MNKLSLGENQEDWMNRKDQDHKDLILSASLPTEQQQMQQP